MITLVTVAVFAALAGYWAVFHRMSLRPGWGKVRKTDLELALARFTDGLDALDVKIRGLFVPSVVEAVKAMRSFNEAFAMTAERDAARRRR